MNKFENILSGAILVVGVLCLVTGFTFFAGMFLLYSAVLVSAMVSSEAWIILPLLAFLCLGGYVVYDVAEALDIVSGVKNFWARSRPEMFRLRLQLSAWGWSTSPKEKDSFQELQSVLKATSLLSHGKNIGTNAEKLFAEWHVRKDNNTPKEELETWLGRNVATLASATDPNLGRETFEDAFERAQAHVNAN